MEYPTNLKYTKEHEWIRVEGDRAVVGITEHAQSELGDVVYVELPQKGKKVKQGEAFAVVESVKAVSDVYSPVDGQVLESNAALNDQPELVNQSPYDKGWIATLKLSDASQLKNLLDAEAYKAFVGSLS